MGYDFARQRPIKHMDTTCFEPVLTLPKPSSSDDRFTHMVGQDNTGEPADMEIDATSSRRYGLYAVIVHTGANANSGHYFTFSRHSSDDSLQLADSPSAPWVLFNDKEVYTFTWKEMTNLIEKSESNTGYLLFYRRLGAKSEPSEPLRSPRTAQSPLKKPRMSDLSDEEDSEIQPLASKLAQALPDEQQERLLLQRLQRWNQMMPVQLRSIMDENASLLTKEFESHTSKAYLTFLQSYASSFPLP
jgi:hypothetical protein